MVTMLTYPPISIPKGGESQLSREDSERVDSLIVEWANLLAPMARIGNRDTLTDLLRTNSPRFLSIKGQLVELLWAFVTDPTQTSAMYEVMRSLCASKADLLEEESLHTLMATIDSVDGLNEWAVGVIQERGPASYRLELIQQQVGESVLRADMCINTLMLVFTDQLTDWAPGSLGMLVSAADEYMTVVEDTFLGSTDVSDTTEDTVAYQSLRKDLGI